MKITLLEYSESGTLDQCGPFLYLSYCDFSLCDGLQVDCFFLLKVETVITLSEACTLPTESIAVSY